MRADVVQGILQCLQPTGCAVRNRFADLEHMLDAIIIGGGHNGLVCACYLAAKGFRVRVLERRHVVGGAAVTEIAKLLRHA